MVSEDQQNFSKEEIERLGLLKIVLQRQKLFETESQILENKRKTQNSLDEQSIKTGELSMKILETQLMAARESMRPHRLYHATIGKDQETGKYFCRVLEYENPEEEPFEISAFGDTPAEACDNFDSLWIGTHK